MIDLDASFVYNLLERIPDEDVIFFNMDTKMCRPLDMMITSNPVPPACIRPTVAMAHGLKNEDDLTIKMAEIIERNIMVK